MEAFELLPGLASKCFVIDLPLCSVLLNDTKDFPWIFLVPRVPGIAQINQLKSADQQQLMREIGLASDIMEELFPCDRVNVAAIGNMTPQLHVHIICRRKSDIYWPDVVWNKTMESIGKKDLQDRCLKIKSKFQRIG